MTMPDKTNADPGRKKLFISIVLTLVTLAVYWQAHRFGFTNYDDNFLVFENSRIQSGITCEALRWAFTTKHGDLWNPFLWLSFMADYQLYGLNAGGYHITNLILHVFSALMLFWFFHRATRALWPSAFVAAVFALHPLHVESVAWVTERKDVLSAFFWMLTLCFYLWYAEKPAAKRYLLVLAGLFCALMSKAMAVTLPAVMILLDYWPLRRFDTRKGSRFLWQVREKAPFFILSAVFSATAFYVQYVMPSKRLVKSALLPLDYRIVNAAVSFATYLEKTFWPHDMAVFYPFGISFTAQQIIVSVLLIAVVSVAVVMKAKRLPYLFVGWLWFVITILPVIKIVQIGNDAMADRYHYLPSIGISVMVAWGVSVLFKSESARKYILFPSALAVVAMLAAVSWHQCGYWRDSVTLFNHALAVTSHNHVAHGQLGQAMLEQGKNEEAVLHFNEALRLSPGYPEVYNQRGAAFIALGQYQKAIDNFGENMRLMPEDSNPYNNRGYVYIKLGKYELALADFNKAIELNPDDAHAYVNRAFIYLNGGDTVSGCRDARSACELGNCKTLQQAQANGFCRP
jgi:Flp pilus assembly protein TadD